MASLANQLHQVATIDDAAGGNPVVLPAPGTGNDELHGRLEPEVRDWANLVQDAVREIGDKLLAIDATEYIRLRAVCKPWRSSTNNHRTWEPCFFPRNWRMLHKDEDDGDAEPTEPAARRRRRFVNVRTGATLWIELPPFDEYGELFADTEGLLLFYYEPTDTWRIFNPLTTATADLPGFAGMPDLEGEPDLTAAGIVVDTTNDTPGGDAIFVPNVVLVAVLSKVTPHRHRSTVILCAKPGDDHWGTVDASVVDVDDVEYDGLLPFESGLSQQGRFYVPTLHGDVLRVELYPQPRLAYVLRPPGHGHDRCTCGEFGETSYLVPSLDDETNNGTGENEGTMLMVRVFFDDEIDVLRVNLSNGSSTLLFELSNRTIFLPELTTLLTDRFPSLAEQGEDEYVHVNEHIEDYIGNAV